MKKCLSIPMVFLTMIAMLNLSVTTHYCMGEAVASRISFSGQITSCEMIACDEGSPVSGDFMKALCCENVVTFCNVDKNFTPSYSLINETYIENSQVLSFPLQILFSLNTNLKTSYCDSGPPGVLLSTNVDLSDICVFRI